MSDKFIKFLQGNNSDLTTAPIDNGVVYFAKNPDNDDNYYTIKLDADNKRRKLYADKAKDSTNTTNLVGSEKNYTAESITSEFDSVTAELNTKYDSGNLGYSANGKNYAIQESDEGKLYVSVPWANTDTLIKVNSRTDNVAYPILLIGNSSPTSGNAYEGYYDSGIKINPSTNAITGVTTISGTSDYTTRLGNSSAYHTKTTIDSIQQLAQDAAAAASRAQTTADSKVSSVSLDSGTNNGTLKLTVNDTSTDNIAVKGLAAAAYKGVVTTIDTSAKLPTSGATKTYVDNQITAVKNSIPALSGGASANIDTKVVGGVTVDGHAISVATKTLTAGNNVQIEATNASTITISATDTTYTLDSFGIDVGANDINQLTGIESNIQNQLDSINTTAGNGVAAAGEAQARANAAYTLAEGKTTLAAVQALGYELQSNLKAAAYKAVTTSLGSTGSDDNLPTEKAVRTALTAVSNSIPSIPSITISTSAQNTANSATILGGLSATGHTISGTKKTITKSGPITITTSSSNNNIAIGLSYGDGLALSSNKLVNSGVRSVATGSTDGTLSVNTNGTTADVKVKGWDDLKAQANIALKTLTLKVNGSTKTTYNPRTADATFDVTLADLGLTKALRFRGKGDTFPTSPSAGDVWFKGYKEYVYVDAYNGATAGWIELGDEGSHATKTELTAGLNSKVNKSGDTMTGSLTFDVGGTHQNLGVKWTAINEKNPYIGYATDQNDGTFVLMSITGTNYNSGLAIGGSSNNLLWKGLVVSNNTHTHTVTHTPAGTIGDTSITPAGSVSSTFIGSKTTHTHVFTGTEATISTKYTPAGSVTSGLSASGTAVATPSSTTTVASSTHTHKYKPAGTVTQPTFTGTEVSTGEVADKTNDVDVADIYSITGVGTAASLTKGVANKCLTLTFTANTVATRSSSYKVALATHDHKVTAAGTVSQPTFTGTEASTTSISGTVNVSHKDHTHSVNVSGTVTSSFTGTEATISTKYTPAGTLNSVDITPSGSVNSSFTGTAATHKHGFTGTKATLTSSQVSSQS